MSTLKIIGFSLAGLAGLATLSLATGAFQYVTAPFFGRVQAERQIESGASRTALYNEFFDLCAGVQAIEGQIDAQTGVQSANTQINLAGLQSRRSQVIAQYNANASKSYTSARFHDAKLPYQLVAGTYTGQNKTACAQ
ncbi:MULTISPECIES: hypothetical protein [unclassified Ensifer]|uniref:hypothetical protein n=1 Tax=unclassified Ensifer TaxID=2633371 RepID=UPI000812E060|nr:MULTISPECIES: hypothetical protein [unclassified Ensifer]OCP21988.1 hypothetical protein BC361_25815 [Ensifer sp. LC54]OCP23232.1 hypothetical protein BC363_24950 [Ensifer sp. LC384]